MKKSMKQKLTSLASGELVAVLVFWFNFFLLKKWLVTTQALISISFSLFVLSFILIQDSVFWWILIKRLANPRFAEKYTGKIYKILKKVDACLLAVGVLLIFWNYSNFVTFGISMAIWLFTVIEWINYYKWQLSYSLNPTLLLTYLLKRKLRKSKIAKEIEKAL